jgi:ribonuclease T1
MGSRRRITFALIGLVVLVVVGYFVRDAVSDPTTGTSTPSSSQGPSATSSAKPLSSLPREAVDTWRLIQKGGPFPSNRDGVVFENREKLLPAEPSGYYHEYTVPTPGSDDRGARRLIYGRSKELYYTEDHYASFVAVDPAR